MWRLGAALERGADSGERGAGDDPRQERVLETEIASLRKEHDRVAALEGLVAQRTALIEKLGAQLDVLAR